MKEMTPYNTQLSLLSGSLRPRTHKDSTYSVFSLARHACYAASALPPWQTQMQSNELLREILGVSKWGGTGGEKQFYSKSSEASKQHTTNRARSRHSKQLEQGRFLESGDARY